jgi:hypothetical protein
MARWAVGTAVMLSAFLLFTVELLAARHVLPRFGGAASVWLACLVLFQLLLLVGYAWSRLLSEWSARRQRLHLVLLAFGAAALALQAALWGTPLLTPADAVRLGGSLGVLAQLSLSVGAPFLALSATAPLLQAWEARRGAIAPWRLYALSNAGALLALGAYPFLIEPTLGLKAQATLWAAAFGLDLLLLGWATWARADAQPVGEAPAPTPPRTAWGWVALSAAGSFTLAAVTNFQTHDLTPAPLLWALPLAIYLSSFIITFESEGWYRRDVASVLIAIGTLAVTWCMARDQHNFISRCLAFGVFQLGVCLLCHGELYRLRPSTSQLGRYYLWMSAGGALGTMVVGFLFPLVAHDYTEFILLVAFAGAGVVAVTPPRRSTRLASGVAMLLLVAGFIYEWNDRRGGQVFSARNFFGVLRVEKDNDSWVLIHGGTVHGRQLLDPAIAHEPSAYYARETGLGISVDTLRKRRGGALSTEVLGLGIGTSVALFEPGDDVVFYEIDPAVVRLAQGEGGWFEYLKTAKARWRIEVGDARIQLAAADPARRVDLVAVDVFSGDAVPMHLITEEALALYRDRLKDDGLLALHVSNRFFDLDRVALTLAPRLGMSAWVYQNPDHGLAAESRWVVMAKKLELLPQFEALPGGAIWTTARAPAAWTDDLSSMLTVLRR